MHASFVRPQCDEVLYDVDQSQTVWPARSYWAVLAEKYNVTFQGQTITEATLLHHAEEALKSESSEEASEFEVVPCLPDDVNDDAQQRSLDSQVSSRIEEYLMNNFARVEIYFQSKVAPNISSEYYNNNSI